MTSILELIALHADLLAAGLSAVATAFAAIATWRGPASAAKLAEILRRDGEGLHEKRRLKLFVFSTLMQERATIWSNEAVKALNLIDVVFYESKDVREAWSDLYLAYDQKQGVPQHVADERLRKLLKSMAFDLNLADNLRLDDFGRIYYPNAIAQEQQIRTLERQESLRKLQGNSSLTANTASQPIPNVFPPRPN